MTNEEQKFEEMMKDLEEILRRNTIEFGAMYNVVGMAETLYNKGYHKTIWHRVADGDLPKETSLYLCKMVYKETYTYEYKVLLFNTISGFYDSGLSITKDAVIAWMELPEYKEKEND